MFQGNSLFTRSVVVLVALCLGAQAQAAGTYHGGSGTADDPYRILTAAHLMELGEHTEDYSKHFVLMADIDMDPDIPGNRVFTQAVIAPSSGIGDTFSGIPFTGTFDGNGHRIKNLTFEYPIASYIGLFGRIGEDGTVEDLGVFNTCVLMHSSYSYLGFLAGYNSGTILNCNVSGTIERNQWYAYSKVGGLVGCNEGVLFDCSASGEIMGDSWVGGLVGQNLNGFIQKCRSSCRLFDSYGNVGGLAGSNEGAAFISYCYATGNVEAGGNAGGLIGYSVGRGDQYAAVHRCYATGSVFNGGGLIGYANYSTVKNCYSIGRTMGGSGLIDNGHWYKEIYNCFWDTQTSGTSSSYGDGTGLPTAQMKQKQTFVDAGWDFYSTWDIVEGRTYPFFVWQDNPLENLCKDNLPFPVGDLNSDCVVNLADFGLFAEHWLEDLRR